MASGLEYMEKEAERTSVYKIEIESITGKAKR